MARAKKLPPTEKALLIALCDRLNDNTGLCCPSYEQLSLDTGYERSTVSRNLKKLRDRGLITWNLARRSGQFGYNVYTIDRVALSHAADNHVANNDNTKLHSLPSPSSTVQHKPLHNPNEPLIREATDDSIAKTHTDVPQGPPETPEEFLCLSRQIKEFYALNKPELMRTLRSKGLNWDRMDTTTQGDKCDQ